jgi:anti-sigma regulatory factor (Ser/Thr protein kinase)
VLETSESKIELQATLSNYEFFMAFIESHVSDTQIGDSDKMKVLTACEEIIVNIVNYAYPNKDGNLEIIFEKKSQDVTIYFIDSGMKFNPLAKPDADTTLSVEEREIGGLGIFMVKKLMDEIKYDYKGNKNCLSITKHL